MSPVLQTHGRRNGLVNSFSRDGFTLVEMLVVITVLMVLMGVSLAVMNVSLEGERVRSGARQVQSYLAGARDRAAYTNRPCGVRFILDDSNPLDKTLIRSMVYIELPPDWKQGYFYAHNFPGAHWAGPPPVHQYSLLAAETMKNGLVDSEDLNGDGYLNRGNGNGILDPGEDMNSNGVLDPGEDSWEDGNNNGQLDVEDNNNNGVIDSGEDLFTSTTQWHRVLVAGPWISKPKIQIGNHWHTVDAFFWRYEDVNGNGFLDPSEDTNSNGTLDGNEDRNHNGQLEPGEDLNNNGMLDPGEDLNNNGLLDPSEDLNNNGMLDLGEDLNNNGWLDPGEDLNNNNRIDQLQCLKITPAMPMETGTRGIRVAQNGYRLQLPPALMSGQEPVSLPTGVVIDLDQCRAAHSEDLNNNGSLDTEDSNGNGVLDPGEDINNNGLLDIEDLDQDGRLDPGTPLALPDTWWFVPGPGPDVVYRRSLDVLFSPNGTVFGAAASKGVIHLVVNDVVDSSLNLFPVDLPAAPTSNQSDKRVVSLFTRTGTATTSELLPTTIYMAHGIPGPPFDNHNQFYWAERGKTE